jgi:hypothetical protein
VPSQARVPGLTRVLGTSVSDRRCSGVVVGDLCDHPAASVARIGGSSLAADLHAEPDRSTRAGHEERVAGGVAPDSRLVGAGTRSPPFRSRGPRCAPIPAKGDVCREPHQRRRSCLQRDGGVHSYEGRDGSRKAPRLADDRARIEVERSCSRHTRDARSVHRSQGAQRSSDERRHLITLNGLRRTVEARPTPTRDADSSDGADVVVVRARRRDVRELVIGPRCRSERGERHSGDQEKPCRPPAWRSDPASWPVLVRMVHCRSLPNARTRFPARSSPWPGAPRLKPSTE